MFGNPTYSVAKRDTQDAHHEVYVGAAQFADEAPPSVSLLVEMQRGISIAMRVILWTQAFDSSVPNA